MHAYSSKTFQKYKKHKEAHHGLGDFKMTNKTTKLPYNMHVYILM
jgi:hypothetical protein